MTVLSGFPTGTRKRTAQADPFVRIKPGAGRLGRPGTGMSGIHRSPALSQFAHLVPERKFL